MSKISSYVIAAEDDGIRLDRWFKRHAPALSQGEIQKAARKGLLRLDGVKAKPSDPVSTGQELIVKFIDMEAAKKPSRPAKKTIALSDAIISETQSWVIKKHKDYLAINKPAGLAVQGGSGVNDHVDGRLAALQYDAPQIPKLVHRIDRDTSGVLLLARSTKSASDMARAFASKQMQKIYWAVIVGVPDAHEGEIEGALVKSDDEVEKMMVDENGKKAITHYRIIEALHKSLALVELRPITGRTHQLRVHMAELGTPILGDGKYGGRSAFVDGLDLPKQLHLHARQIIVPGLFGGIDVSAPLPKHMLQSFKSLGISAR